MRFWNSRSTSCLEVRTLATLDHCQTSAVACWEGLMSWTVRHVLLFFTPLCNVSCQDVQIRSTAHRELPAALLLLEQYHIIVLVSWQQSPSSDSLNKGNINRHIFLEGVRSSWFFRLAKHKSTLIDKALINLFRLLLSECSFLIAYQVQ
jgi:hypothetical protein